MGFQHVILGLAASVLLGVGASVAAPIITISGSIGGAPTGVTLENFDSQPLGASGGAGSSGIVVSFQTNAQVVTGSSSGLYAAPFLSGGNGAGFGSPNQANGADATPYITTGSSGSVAGAQATLTLPFLSQYFGLLWGSVDAYNVLSFYNGATLVFTVTGADVTASPNGNQGVNGTVYVNINADTGFDRVVATSTSYAFEFDNVAINRTQVAVPEPGTLALFGVALAGLGLARRRKAG